MIFSQVLDALFPPRDTELLVRAIGEASLLNLLDPETRVLWNGSSITMLPYEEPSVRACVVEAKFHANRRAARLLGSVAAAFLEEELRERLAFERLRPMLVPIPLSPARLRERGYNQAEAIARHAASLLELEVDIHSLIRTRYTLPQTELDAEARQRNVRGAFAAARPPDADLLYIVLDDVLTTGATMSEAAGALKKAGARHVLAVALAH